MNTVYLFSHPLFREHDTGPGHPECSERLDAIVRGIRRRGLAEQVEWVDPLPARREDLLRVHTPEHVERILSLRGIHESIDADTQVSPSSVEAALLASGACIQSVDKVLGHSASFAFCVSRPPGHHAERDRAMGFCLFNHVAVAAAHAVAGKGVDRVLVFDPDVHHGNGTQDIFYEQSEVCYVSIHQSPLFPGTGEASERGAGKGKGFNINLPLPPGLGDAEYCYATQKVVVPLITSFDPGLVILSAGFDAHEDDPLGGMKVTTAGFVEVYSIILRALAAKQIPAVFCLEGGYSLSAIEETVPAVLDLLLQGSSASPVHYGEPHPAAQRVVAEALALQSE